VAVPELWYRLGSVKEQGLLERYKGRFHGLVIPAHILVWWRTWINEFLPKLGKPFIVDPMTFALALDPGLISKETGVKKSWEKLIGHFGKNVSKAFSSGPLKPNALVDNKGESTPLLDSIIRKSLELQTDLCRSKSPSQASLDKYRQMLGEETKGEIKPDVLVAPYFLFKNESDPWYSVNVASVQEMVGLRGKSKVHAVVLTEMSFLHSADWSRVARDFKGVDGLILWISGFNERRSNVADLTAVAMAVRELSQRVETIHMLYGGYFSLSLATLGLSRLSHGICYGDSKSIDVKATGGGFATRFYLKGLKMKTVNTNAQVLFSDHPVQPCRCPVCAELWRASGMSGRGKPTVKQIEAYFSMIDEERAGAHFMETRYEEAVGLRGQSANEIASLLRRMKADAAPIPVRDYDLESDHLGRWAETLEGC